jgi:hypothetical protein
VDRLQASWRQRFKKDRRQPKISAGDERDRTAGSPEPGVLCSFLSTGSLNELIQAAMDWRQPAA